MKKIMLCALSLTVFGCAMNYTGPQALSVNATEPLSQPKATILIAAKRALVADGYQITSQDDGSGIISTAPRDMRLTPQTADCGTTLGIDYLLDNRTSTRVSVGVIVYPAELAVKSTIQGEYKPGSVSQDITLSCVSRGLIEQDMLRKIKAEANRL